MSDAVVDPEFAFDPMDQSKTKDPELLRRLRQERPVVRPAEHVVYTARYHDTASVFKNAKRYSSVGDMRAPGVTVPEEESFLGELDPPLHPRIRRILLRGFTPERAIAAEPWTRSTVRARLETIGARGDGDLMNELGIPLPVEVAAHVLGIPDELHEKMHTWCNELLHSTWPALGKTERGEGIEGAFPEFAATIDALIAERRTPKEGGPTDLLAVMVQTEADDGWRIHEQHVRTLTINVLAGSLSTSYMIGNLLYRYLTDEGGFAGTIRADRSLIPAAVEESLRFEAPVTFLFRSSREETAIDGCPIHVGDHIMMGISSANRDETVYPDANEFRLDRSGEPEHLAFGAGPHLCLGNHLTRMIGRVTLEEVLDRFAPGQLRLVDGFVWECVDHPLEYGPEHLPVRVG
jgi:cytochrome P450